jgi:hypothetical protein
MINEWGGKMIFQTGLVQVMEVHAHANRTLFFLIETGFNIVTHYFHHPYDH